MLTGCFISHISTHVSTSGQIFKTLEASSSDLKHVPYVEYTIDCLTESCCALWCQQQTNCLYFKFITANHSCTLCHHSVDIHKSSQTQHGSVMVKTNLEVFFCFGNDSYFLLDAVPPYFGPKCSLHLQFRSQSANGTIVYGPPWKSSYQDVYMVYLKNGKVGFSFNNGDYTATATTSQLYNDGRWHCLEASRNNKKGYLRVDKETFILDTRGNQNEVTTRSIRFGQVDQTYSSRALKEFVSCLKESINLAKF